jgi:hypothetical protein
MSANELLACFKELGGLAAVEDHLEAAKLSTLPLEVGVITAKMRAIKQRNGPTWRPTRLKYFHGAITDLLKQQSPSGLQAHAHELPDADGLTAEEHEAALAHLRELQTPEQRRRVELVTALKPRPTLKELQHLLHERTSDAEFAARLSARGSL